MGRTRQIKYEACLDEDLAQLPFEARLCFLMLPTIADRAGRLEDRPLKISAQIFPYDSVDVEGILELLATPRQYSNGSFLTRYETEDGHKYIQINNFEKHQNPHPNEKQSDIPGPSGNGTKCNYISLKANGFNANTSGSGSQYSGPSGSGPSNEASAVCRASTKPPVVRWEPKPTWKKDHPSLAKAQLIVDGEHLKALSHDFPRIEGDGGGVQAEISKFKRHWLDNPSKAKRKKDWKATLTNWLKGTDERFDDERFKDRQAQARASPSPDAMGLTGQHEHTDYTEEIAACVKKNGAKIHSVENLITSGKSSPMRWCKFQCGFSERKT